MGVPIFAAYSAYAAYAIVFLLIINSLSILHLPTMPIYRRKKAIFVGKCICVGIFKAVSYACLRFAYRCLRFIVPLYLLFI
jgi:hypothetical protein